VPDRLVSSATCLGCGCSCDDITLVIRNDRIVEARQACALGVAWFGDGTAPAGAHVDGKSASVDDAIDAAVAMLSRATRPLVYLAPELSCEAQREAVALGDVLRALVDSITSMTAAGSILSAQALGRAGATLGEVRNRADVVVFWGVDPAERYPRFASRYAPDPSGLHVPDGRRSRQVVAVDVGDSRGPADADLRVSVTPDDAIATLTATAALSAISVRLQAASPVGISYDHCTGPAWDAARQLAPVVAQAHYVAIVADGEPASHVESEGFGRRSSQVEAGSRPDGGHSEALIRLSQALNGPTRCALITLRGGGNRPGADAVLTGQTGYPMAVDFSRGYPQYRPHDHALDLLARHDVDAAVVIGSPARLPGELTAAVASIPHVAVGPSATASAIGGNGIAIDTGVAGIHESGTALRMDDVPLPLRPPLSGPPPAADVVRRLAARLDRRA
jgi:formylmethanofuran dehydrogenase subunit B